MKKQHEIRFSSKRPLQIQNSSQQQQQMAQTRTKQFYDSNSSAQKQMAAIHQQMGQTMNLSAAA